MPTVLAITTLYNAVVARFTLDSTVCEQSFGWKESAKLSPTNARITWTPGDANGALGSISGAKQPGRNPRSLATLEELVTCDIQAYDPLLPTSEPAQYEATRLLFDAWYRAVYLAARGTFKIISTNWIRPKSGLTHGAAIRVVLTVEAKIPDIASSTAPADSHNTTTIELLDHEETLTISEVV
jgi:hypothetical protein